MKKHITAALFLSVLISLLAAMNAFAGEWLFSPYYSGSGGDWYYRLDDGGFARGWHWINGLCYCFDDNGRMYSDTVTPDGYAVNQDGVWIVNGIIQRQGQAVNISRVVTPYFSFIPPDYWVGKYSWQVWDGRAVTFYDDANRPWGGHLFTIISRSEPYSEFPDYGDITYIGAIQDHYTGEYSYLYEAGPTDVPFDYETAWRMNEYQTMANQDWELISTIQGPHGENLIYQGKAY